MSPPDSDLIASVIVSDDRAAFGELVRRHQSAVRGFLRHLCRGDAPWADDLSQETFLHAYRRLADYRGDARFSTWLLGIAHNQFRNAWRKARVRDAHAERPTEESTPAGTRPSDLAQDLAAALRQLNSDEQMALHLFYQQGLSHPEIAQAAGWPLGTVKTHLARAKDKLRPLLSAWNPQT